MNSGRIILPVQPVSQSSLTSSVEGLDTLCADRDVPAVSGGIVIV